MSNGLSEVPDAIAAYAAGVGAAVGRGGFYTLVFLLVLLVVGLAPVGLGVVLLVLAVVLPAIGVAVALELPRVVRERFGGD
ncbi:hypothetical protein [Halogeometricum sp. CBA1124]|mgnify:FL=1|jgi:hypothetical protein|uniref:hypothetical protein n=1 Tax=Halogeometricum sp. CBA1124 TaxID=2668071 RepID=UPI00142B5A25|nr:hypothetical protein [Halogeometricum sp. CBA1124]MUV57582.1 hypothetical protein [Halogeometricum sp. CBA1124]